MPRVARIVAPACPHHVTQRGNNQQDVFFVDDDYRLYLDILKRQCELYGMSVLGYCLMTNHVHLIGVPHEEQSLAKAVGRTNWLYAQAINRLHGRSGHLWQSRFYSCVMDDDHTWAALAYVERNPVRAGVVRRAWNYTWSSAAAHCGKRDRAKLLDLAEWQSRLEGRSWQETLAAHANAELLGRLRLHTHRGRPLGSDSFISKLERAVGRRLRPLHVGRPRKTEP